MYRGQRIENRKKLIDTCLRLLESGTEQQLYEILPHMSVVRSPAFVEPLLKLLKTGTLRQKEFAALAMGTLQDDRCLDALSEAFLEVAQDKDEKARSVQTAIVVGLGDTGEERAVEALLRIYEIAFENDSFGPGRRRLVLSALGALAQQGSVQAEQELVRFMGEKNPSIRAQAVMELSVAYWHRPNDLPRETFEKIVALAEQRGAEVRSAALSALSNLANLGCRAAERYASENKRAKEQK